jgi:putative spermidine/putrescine transport system permease protein
MSEAMLTTSDGRPLKQALARAQGRAKRRAFWLVAPLLAFVVITFLVPIGQMLHRSIYHDGFSANAPQVSAWFATNPRDTIPDEAAYAALAADFKQMQADRTAGLAGTRVNYTLPETRSLFTKTARSADELAPPYKEALLAVDPKWGEPIVWEAMRSASTPYTSDFYLIATDRERTEDGSVARVPENQRIYIYLFVKTFILSAIITLICLLLAFPVAHLDITSCAHDKLDRAAAGAGRGQRNAGGAWHGGR